MARLIDADALIEKYTVVIRKTADEKLKTEIAVLLKDIEEQPTVGVIPIRKGTWTEEYDEEADLFFKRRWRCSACNGWNTYGTPSYCPECGAEMTNSTKRKKEANHDQID